MTRPGMLSLTTLPRADKVLLHFSDICRGVWKKRGGTDDTHAGHMLRVEAHELGSADRSIDRQATRRVVTLRQFATIRSGD